MSTQRWQSDAGQPKRGIWWAFGLLFILCGWSFRTNVHLHSSIETSSGVEEFNVFHSPQLGQAAPPSNRSLPFPRWADSTGIQWSAIEGYIRLARKHLEAGKDLLLCPNGGCPPDMPNVLYVFGASPSPHLELNWNQTSVGATPTIDSRAKVWVEGRRRKRVGKGFMQRYPIVEALLDDALTHLLQIDRPEVQYPRLAAVVRPDPPSHPKSTLLGVPLLLNLGDNRQCLHQNLQWNHKLHNVPVFTLAVPWDCQYAFPIPHPAVIETALRYGANWTLVHSLRHQEYPFDNKTRQAVWRGSPTGMSHKQTRYHMVNTANTPPDDLASDSMSTQYFNVAFGKNIRKVFPKHQGPDVKGRDRIPFDDFAKYRVILDADGSSWSERFVPLLCLNSVVAKLEPMFVDWLWPLVQANVHYIPVSDDASNLWSAVLPLLQRNIGDTQRYQNMVHQANDFCATHVTYPRMIEDVLHSLEQYVTLLEQDDSEGAWQTHWQRLLTEGMRPKHHHWKPLPVATPNAYLPANNNEA